MPPVVIQLSNAEDPRDVIHRAVQALAEGKLVAFPTETVYGLAASALNEDAVKNLLAVKRRAEGNPLTLAIKSVDDAFDYVPDLSPLANRLARRCWPGPVTLVLNDQHPESLIRRLPETVREAVSPKGTVGLRAPAHPTILSVLRLLAGPLVLSSANRSGEPDAVEAQEIVDSLADDVDLVLDDGRCKYAQPSAVIQVEGNHMKLLRRGVLTDLALKRLSSFMVLLVCTGNTCRSPMAEILMRKRIAEKLGCKLEELDDSGVIVMSAGIAAMNGGRAAPEAVQAAAQYKLDLSDHESQPLSERLVQYADLILTMTQGHKQAILAQWPEACSRTELLCRDGRDVSDPIGGSAELYRNCAQQIDSQLQGWVEQLDFKTILETTETPKE